MYQREIESTFALVHDDATLFRCDSDSVWYT